MFRKTLGDALRVRGIRSLGNTFSLILASGMMVWWLRHDKGCWRMGMFRPLFVQTNIGRLQLLRRTVWWIRRAICMNIVMLDFSSSNPTSFTNWSLYVDYAHDDAHDNKNAIVGRDHSFSQSFSSRCLPFIAQGVTPSSSSTQVLDRRLPVRPCVIGHWCLSYVLY
jgi:hypothetical protein